MYAIFQALLKHGFGFCVSIEMTEYKNISYGYQNNYIRNSFHDAVVCCVG